SIEMALKIEKWLGVEQGGRAEIWAGMQLDHDMWQARHDQAVA
ncbi:MAG: addiction module antidote protein, HigA family, partial [Gammaproteobacteria bacterium]|nr:addiction module antidote protein, HigA family [Gammaproteobacteria bacterium]